MGVLNNLLEDSKTIPQTFKYKYRKNILTIGDQKEALTTPCWSYRFAKANIPGSDIKALQEKACEEPNLAYWFALHIPEANIKYCQEHACKDPWFAYCFALNIPSADIKYCQEQACKDPECAYDFVKDIHGADKEYCRQACKGTLWEF